MSINGVIFDVDGTLVDSNAAHAHAWQQALARHGLEVALEPIRRCIGMGGDKLLPAVCGVDIDSPQGKAIGATRQQIFKTEYLPHLKPFPQVRELLLTLRQQGLRLVVASSAKKAELEPLLAIANVADLLESSTSSDDAEESKPDPDIVEAALKQLDLAPAAVIMVGDTPYDVEAASRAGIACIGVRCGGWDAAGLHAAAAVYADPAQLLEQLARSPLAQ